MEVRHPLRRKEVRNEMNMTNKLLAGVLAAIIGFGSFGSYKLIIAWKAENRMNYSEVRAKLDAERCGPKPVRN